MFKRLFTLSIESLFLVSLFLLAACSSGQRPIGSTPSSGDGKLQVETTIGMVADLVRQVGGERVEVGQLMGPGVDPHLYKTTSADAARLGRADVIFYSGLMLEGRMSDLFLKLARRGVNSYPVTETIPEGSLLEPEEFEGHWDPHAWFDVELWAMTIPAIVNGLGEADPEGRVLYEANGRALEERLAALHRWCIEQANLIPEEQRILITSHDAYNYFGKKYGFKVVGLQGVSTVSEAALADMASLVDFIKKQGVKAIFVETSVNPEAIKRVATDAGVKVGGELSSDSLGKPGTETGTYIGMIRHNTTTMVEALK